MRDQELKLEEVETSHNGAGEDGIQGEGSGEEAICIESDRERAHARACVWERPSERASERGLFALCPGPFNVASVASIASPPSHQRSSSEK